MREAILKFPEQLIWEPKVENLGRLQRAQCFIVAGMGGSALAADLLKVWDPYFKVLVHRNYGLPSISEEQLRQSLIIVSSYSGNTEETLDAYKEARENKLAIAALSTGGKLLELARKDGIPYVQIPDTGIQPRSAIGFSIKGLLRLMSQDYVVKELSGTGKSLKILGATAFEDQGKQLAENLKDRVPIIYASEKNYPIAYNWKIKFNETGKIPAFCNAFPELNHNEMQGFDYTQGNRNLSEKFYFIFLKDSDDLPRIRKRRRILKKILKARGFLVDIQELEGVNVWHKMFSSLLTADWAAYYTALNYGADPEKVLMVEEFKRMML